MNTYRVILGCLVILCYLRQQAWGVPSQMENAKPFHWEAADLINKVNLKDHTHIQKRYAQPLILDPIQYLRNIIFQQYKCNYDYLKFAVGPDLEVSNAMYAYASSYTLCISVSACAQPSMRPGCAAMSKLFLQCCSTFWLHGQTNVS